MTMTDSESNPRNSLVKFSITFTVKGGSLDVSTGGPPQYYYVVYSHDILTVTAGILIPMDLVRQRLFLNMIVYLIYYIFPFVPYLFSI